MMRVVGALTGAFVLVGAVWKGGEWTVDHVHKVNDAVPVSAFMSYVRSDSIHHARTDSILFSQVLENRALLCYMAKSPTPMVVAGLCPRPVITQAGRERGGP